jgi:hypothetical protein
MAKPVITTVTSVQYWSVGFPNKFTLNFTGGTPTSWTATGLPEGVEIGINGDGTADVQGIARVNGTFTVRAVATNADGDCDVPLIFPIIVVSGTVIGLPAKRLNFNVQTNEVTVPGTAPAADAPLLFARTGDLFELLVGYHAGDNALMLLDNRMIVLTGKQREPENELVVSDATCEVVWTTEGPRYKCLVSLQPDVAPLLLGSVSENEKDKDTFADLRTQLACTFFDQVFAGDEEPRELTSTSQTFVFRVSRKL